MARGQISQPSRGISHGVNQKYALRSAVPPHRATQTTPLFDRVHYETPVVAIDIEFQRYTLLAEPMSRVYKKSGAPRRTQHLRLGRISIVNFGGDTVLDTFAYYPENDGTSEHVPLTYHDRRFGVTSAALDPAKGARPGSQVEAFVRSIVRDSVVVLHGGSGDMKAFYYEQDLWEDVRAIVDTQDLWGIKNLRHAARDHLDNLEVQVGDHSSLEDSQTTMKLFRRFLTDNNLTLEQWLRLNAPVHTHDEDTACADNDDGCGEEPAPVPMPSWRTAAGQSQAEAVSSGSNQGPSTATVPALPKTTASATIGLPKVVLPLKPKNKQ